MDILCTLNRLNGILVIIVFKIETKNKNYSFLVITLEYSVMKCHWQNLSLI